MSSTDAQKRAVVKYNKSRDNIMIRPDKETGAAIRAAAAEAGQSNQQYILQATLERIEGKTQTSADLSLEDQQRVDQHIEKTGETAPAFVSRAITDTIDRDNQLFRMGLKPKTGE